jgi:hypothetical protein
MIWMMTEKELIPGDYGGKAPPLGGAPEEEI